jgi:hypothetical protein
MRGFYLVVLTCIVLLLGACGLLGEGSSDRGASRQNDAGVCVRDLVAIDELITHPRACVTDEQCPDGSFCNPASGACDWECVQDTTCGPSGTCGCDGRCVRPDMPEGPVAGACERDEPLLASLITAPRACRFDEDCPSGARCGETTRTCVYDCTADATCDDGEACDCLGRCLVPGTPPPVPSDRLVRLSVSPARMPVAPEGDWTWEPRRLEVQLTGPDLDRAVEVAAAEVEARATTGLAIACDDNTTAGASTAPPDSAYAGRCTFTTAWHFSAVSGPAIATKYVWVKPVPPGQGQPAVTIGDVVLTSSRVAGSPATAQLAPIAPTLPDEQPLGTTYSFDGEYTGTVTALGPTSARELTPAAPVVPTTITVDAWASGEDNPWIDLYDATRILSPTGKVRILGLPLITDWLVPADREAGAIVDTDGRLLGSAWPVEVDFSTTTGILRGVFEIQLQPWDDDHRPYAPYRYRFELHQTGPLRPCAAGCRASEVCEPVGSQEVCEPGPTTPGKFGYVGEDGLASQRDTAWGDWLSTLASKTRNVEPDVGVESDRAGLPDLYVGDLYDAETGWARAASEPVPVIVNSNALSNVADFGGFALCLGDFRNYRSWLDAATSGGVHLAAIFWFADAIPDAASTCLRIWGGPFFPRYELGDLAPCIDSVPTAPAGATNWLRSLDSDARRGSCQEVYSAWRAATGSSQSESQFLTQTCHSTEVAVRLGPESQLGTPTSLTRYPVRLCPYLPQMLPAQTPEQTAMSLLCFDPEGWTDTALGSSHFADPLAVSGDLICASGATPHGADLVYDVDRAAEAGVLPTPAGTMLASCMDELLEMPPDRWRNENPDAPEVGAAYDETFRHRACFSPPHFFGAYRASASGVAAAKLRHRLLAQWLAVHGFLAKEAAQASAMASASDGALALGDADQSAVADTPSVIDVLGQMERGWNYLLDNDQSDFLFTTDVAALREPDYRPAAAPDGEADVGVPVHILETAALHLDLAARLLDDARLASYDECRLTGHSELAVRAVEIAGQAVRYTTAAETLATIVFDRSTATSCSLDSHCGTGGTCSTERQCIRAGAIVRAHTVAWQSRWDAARTQYAAARQRVAATAHDLLACRSPLATNERIVPLFFGDPSGTSSQFFAASDYLLAGWAKPAVERATAAFEAARGAWTQKRASEVQEQLTTQEADRRREGIAIEYGNQIKDMCGLTDVSAAAIIEGTGRLASFEPGSCFVDTNAPECQQFTMPEVAEQSPPLPPPDQIVTNDTRLLDLCPDDSWVRDGLGVAPENMTVGQVRHVYCQVDQLAYRLTNVDDNTAAIAASFQSLFIVRNPANGRCHVGAPVVGATGSVMYALYALMGGLNLLSPALLDAADVTCTDFFETTVNELRPDLTSHAECFRGQMGEAFLKLAAAKKDVELAVMDLKDIEDDYDAATRRCIFLKEWTVGRETLLGDHAQYLGKMRQLRAAAQTIGTAISVGAGFWGVALNGGVADASPLAVGALLGGFEDEVADAEAAHQLAMAKMQSDQELYTCMSEARAIRLRIDNKAAIVERAVIDSDHNAVVLGNHRRRVYRLLTEGRAALEREEGRTVPPIAFHYWLDERIDNFHEDFSWAKALTYMAIGAVEFEYQQSMAIRDEVMTATHPDQLDDAIRVLEQTQISRTINGRRPEENTIVRSVVREVLDLDDLRPEARGERRWTALQRFQNRLWSPEYAVYADDGQYLGQGIPFSFEPEDELEHTCAERVWRVTATVQGDTLSETQPSVPVMLMKSNTFASQWCDGKGDGSPLQVASVQPVSQLFHPEDRGGDEAQAQPFISARMRPYFNVPRSSFYSDSYGEGASTELAGRGLYGDYVLLFPAAGLLDKGFPLHKVEDVLLRFDYLSVDDIQFSGHRLATATGRD